MKLIIVALRRSGTTAFWSAFRKDARFIAFNEPFNPTLTSVGDDKWPALPVHQEYRRLLTGEPGDLWDYYRPVPPEEELACGLSDRQSSYLAWLLSRAEHVCVDSTRAYYKLDDLHRVCPDAVVVHLYRPPERFARSILQPSSSLLNRIPDRWQRRFRIARRAAANLATRPLFWSMRDPRTFSYGAVLRRGLHGMFARRVSEAGLSPRMVEDFPAVGRLLTLWKLAFEQVETRGPALWGSNFVSINFHDFSRSPRPTLARIYERLCLEMPDIDLSYVHGPEPMPELNDPRWAEYRRLLGLPQLG